MSVHEKNRATRSVMLPLFIAATVAACAPRGDTPDKPAQSAISASGGEVSALDDRTAIQVDADVRAAVMREMRVMLNAVQGIVGGAARGDTAAMRSSASLAGTSAASEAGANVAAQLGPEFVMLGMTTHVSFDSLAADIARGKQRDAVLTRLGSVMGNCVGCHNRFRLVTQP